MRPFSTESLLVDAFVASLADECSPWGDVSHSREFDYQRGRTDVVVVTTEGQVLAFEAKLDRWRDALHQAYRNRCFADASYVVLPKRTALNAIRFGHEFDRRGVGICYVDDGELVVLHDSAMSEPLQPWLREAAISSVSRPDACALRT